MLQNDTNARLNKGIKKDTDSSYYFGVIDVLHEAVHEKKMHTISLTTLSVARLAWGSEGKSRLKTYIGTTYSANGTVYTPFNRQTKEANNLECVVYVNPTINVLGTARGNDFVGSGGATAQRIGGTGSSDIETIVNAGTELLIEVQNVRGSASDLNLICNIYERLKF